MERLGRKPWLVASEGRGDGEGWMCEAAASRTLRGLDLSDLSPSLAFCSGICPWASPTPLRPDPCEYMGSSTTARLPSPAPDTKTHPVLLVPRCCPEWQ